MNLCYHAKTLYDRIFVDLRTQRQRKIESYMEKSSKFILNNRYSGMDKEIQRSILMFENGCSSDYTRNMYRSKLNQLIEGN